MENLLTAQNLHIAIIVIAGIIALVIFLGIVIPDWNAEMENVADNTEDALKQRLQLSKKGYFNYERLDNYLRRKGIYRMFPEANPMLFIGVKVLVALLFFVIGIAALNVYLGLALAIPGFFFADLIVNIMNNSDNDDMMDDIKSIFDTLKIQTKAGVFLTYSLCECYLIVENSRLKAALLDMTNMIISKNQILTALHRFNEEFDNPYIDTLCITIEQSLESGKSAQILDDLSKQIADMQRAINIRESEKLDSKIQILQVLIFVCIICIAVYALAMIMVESFNQI